MRRFIVLSLAAMLVVAAFALPAAAGSPIKPDLIHVDGDTYGTILLKALPYNQGNAHSFDNLYVFPNEEQTPIAEFAPGDKDYNGGRWLPIPVTWNVDVDPYVLGSVEALEAAADLGDVTIGGALTGGTFLCPLIPNH